MTSLECLWWNVERLFGPKPGEIGRALSATRADKWTAAAYAAKLRRISDVLRGLFPGAPPAILAMAEVEDKRVVDDLLEGLGWNLGRADPPYEAVQAYDVVVMYDPAQVSLVGDPTSYNVHHRFLTRDILMAAFSVHGKQFSLIANHWPSRLVQDSEAWRIALGAYCYSLVKQQLTFAAHEVRDINGRYNVPKRKTLEERWNRPCIVIGDFNDCPYDTSITRSLHATNSQRAVLRPPQLTGGAGKAIASRYSSRTPRLYNPMWRFLSEQAGGGTAFFRDSMFLVDQLLLSRGAVSQDSSLRVDLDSIGIVREIPGVGSLATRSGRPRRFNRIKGTGFSDHLPLRWRIEVDGP